MATPDRIAFQRQEPAALTLALQRVLDARRGWVNVQPDLDGIDPRSLARPSIFAARGRAIPLGTFVPATQPGGEHQLGVEHGAGRHAADQLRGAGVVFPTGARLVQDHPRRGLVIAIPDGTAMSEVATLLIDIVTELTAVVIGDRWIAELFG